MWKFTKIRYNLEFAYVSIKPDKETAAWGHIRGQTRSVRVTRSSDQSKKSHKAEEEDLFKEKE